MAAAASPPQHLPFAFPFRISPPHPHLVFFLILLLLSSAAHRDSIVSSAALSHWGLFVEPSTFDSPLRIWECCSLDAGVPGGIEGGCVDVFNCRSMEVIDGVVYWLGLCWFRREEWGLLVRSRAGERERESWIHSKWSSEPEFWCRRNFGFSWATSVEFSFCVTRVNVWYFFVPGGYHILNLDSRCQFFCEGNHSCACQFLVKSSQHMREIHVLGSLKQWSDDQGSCKANHIGGGIIYSPYYERSLKDTSRGFISSVWCPSRSQSLTRLRFSWRKRANTP